MLKQGSEAKAPKSPKIDEADLDTIEDGFDGKKDKGIPQKYEWGKWSFFARLFFIDVDPLIAYAYK